MTSYICTRLHVNMSGGWGEFQKAGQINYFLYAKKTVCSDANTHQSPRDNAEKKIA